MPAIRPHSTKVVDEPWDGPKMVARLKNDAPASYYRKMFAWYDPEADPETKGAYKFPHHMVDGEGNIGPANLRACYAIIAVLNGARGGADIPAEDREGVWRHAARHIRDAGKEPPELKAVRDVEFVERRAFTVEWRAEEKDGRPRLVGYAAVFNRESENLGGYVEIIAPGAFDDVLDDDVRALWNHDPKYVLGRTKVGTLHLEVDEKGLKVEITPPDTQWARDLMESIRRGDVDQMSFAFEVADGGDEWVKKDGKTVRTIRRIGRLYDVSVVTFPAYPQTEVTLRVAPGMVPRLREMLRGLAVQGCRGPEGREQQGLTRYWARWRLESEL